MSATRDNANAKGITAGGRSDGDSNRESTETHLQSFTPLTAPSYIHTSTGRKTWNHNAKISGEKETLPFQTGKKAIFPFKAMTTNSPRLRTHSHILVVCVKYADFLPGDLTRNYSPNLSDTKTILTHTRTTGSKSVWFTIQVFRTRGIETGVPQIRCVCVCVCARARNHICGSHIRIVKCSP